ncbi:unnamed protein product [Moneuplotes crassus]|uniref:CUB domain-containing protein n=1 Tax=Euplotes crassus TaxID=5936 RepID=A0AAD1XHG1_EUPCR|nr:unnamed protein product [Moneuplotes crassus]
MPKPPFLQPHSSYLLHLLFLLLLIPKSLLSQPQTSKISYKTSDCRQCLEASSQWCRPNFEHSYGRCCIDGECDQRGFECTEREVRMEDYLLCPTDFDSCGTQIKWTNGEVAEYVFQVGKIPLDSLCWYKLIKTESMHREFIVSTPEQSKVLEHQIFHLKNGTLHKINTPSVLLEHQDQLLFLYIPTTTNHNDMEFRAIVKDLNRSSFRIKYIIMSSLCLVAFFCMITIICKHYIQKKNNFNAKESNNQTRGMKPCVLQIDTEAGQSSTFLKETGDLATTISPPKGLKRKDNGWCGEPIFYSPE